MPGRDDFTHLVPHTGERILCGDFPVAKVVAPEKPDPPVVRELERVGVIHRFRVVLVQKL
jgi:hypothetical protein